MPAIGIPTKLMLMSYHTKVAGRTSIYLGGRKISRAWLWSYLGSINLIELNTDFSLELLT